MTNNAFIKSLVIGIIILLIGVGVTPEISGTIKNLDVLNSRQTIFTLNRSNLYVGGNGPKNYTKIQDAIDNASDQDTIFVYDDSSPYYEINILISKSINLIGEDRNTTIVDGGGEDIFLIRANNVSLHGLNIQNARYGLRLESSLNTSVSYNIFANNRLEGIHLANSSYNIISNNIVQYNNYGICLDWTAYGPGPCTYNTIFNNTISNNNYRGIQLSLYHTYNNIIGNTIANNNQYGIKICCYCNDNFIYHNNFQSNGQNAEDLFNNIWDNGYPSGGNYWDDYNGTDADGDDIGDTPYNISGGDNQDRYPLMEPYSGNCPPTPPIISGPKSGKVKTEYEYNITLFDPNNDSMYLWIDWGNGEPGPWQGLYKSNTTITFNHTWYQKGTFIIRVQAKDIYDTESDWATLTVTMPKIRTIKLPFLQFLENLIINHHNLYLFPQKIIHKLWLK